jgi:diguanylate cyclase (GGDEF)-like protein
MPSLLRHWLKSLASFRPGVGLLFATALIPGILTGSILAYGIYHTERDRLEQGALQTARALLKAIDAELSKAETTALVLSRSEHLQTKNFAAFYGQAKEVIKITGIGNNYVLSDVAGQQILNTARPFPGPLPRHGNPDQLRLVLETGRPVISDIYLGAVLRRPLFSIDVPVLLDGKITYILSIGLLPAQFNQLLAEQKLPAGWIAALLDSQDTVVARNLNPEQTVGKKATADLQAQIRLRSEGTMASQTLEGKPSFISFTRSPISRWTIAIGMTRDVLYENLHYLIAFVLFSFMAVLVGGIVLAWFFSRYLRHSLEALGAATDAAASGDECARAPTSNIQEIARLADQFNRMQEARKRMEEQIHLMAFYDQLTRLANRRLLHDRLRQGMALSERSGRYGALLFLDLDNFKPLNDTYGHAVGDLLLIEVADRLKNCVREIDTVARFGGDEFVVLINELNADPAESAVEAGLIAEKIRISLAAPYRLSMTDEGGTDTVVEHHCTVTIGVTLFINHKTGPDDILKQADAAMYQAKEAGRNSIRFYEPETLATASADES